MGKRLILSLVLTLLLLTGGLLVSFSFGNDSLIQGRVASDSSSGLSEEISRDIGDLKGSISSNYCNGNDCPYIFQATKSVLPGEIIGIQGDNFGENPQIFVDILSSGEEEVNPELDITDEIITASDDFIGFRAPDVEGVYAIFVYTAQGLSKPMYINLPEVYSYLDLASDEIDSGREFRIQGINLDLPTSKSKVYFSEGYMLDNDYSDIIITGDWKKSRHYGHRFHENYALMSNSKGTVEYKVTLPEGEYNLKGIWANHPSWSSSSRVDVISSSGIDTYYVNYANTGGYNFGDKNLSGEVRIIVYSSEDGKTAIADAFYFQPLFINNPIFGTTLEDGDPYLLKVISPDLEVGNYYNIWVSNGYGNYSSSGKWLKAVPSSSNSLGLDVPWAYQMPYIDNVYNIKTDSVFDIKAKGDRTSDDSLAIQNAIDVVHGLGGGTVYLPEGIYNTKGTKLFLKHNVTLIGDGIGKTIILDDGPTGSDSGFLIEGYRGSQGSGYLPELMGLADLSVILTENANNKQVFKTFEGEKIFILRSELINNAGGEVLYLSKKDIIVQDSRIIQNPPGQRGKYIVYAPGMRNLVMKNNYFYWTDGRVYTPSTAYAQLEGNTWTRQGGFAPCDGSFGFGGPVFNNAKNLVFLNNVLDTLGDEKLCENNDGETILVEGVTDYGLGDVVSASSNTLKGDFGSKDTVNVWETNSLSGKRVMIIDGPGMGQIKRIASNTEDAITLGDKWDVVPTSDSTFTIVENRGSKWLIQGNTLKDAPRGIWLYGESLDDISILDNTIIDASGIYVRADQRLTQNDGRFNIFIDLTISNNTLRSTKNWYPSQIKIIQRYVNGDKLYGNAFYGVKVKDNLVDAFTPNIPSPSSVGQEYSEGYVVSSIIESKAVPNINRSHVGVILEDNHGVDTDYTYYLGTGASQTIVKYPPQKDGEVSGINYVLPKYATSYAKDTGVLESGGFDKVNSLDLPTIPGDNPKRFGLDTPAGSGRHLLDDELSEDVKKSIVGWWNFDDNTVEDKEYSGIKGVLEGGADLVPYSEGYALELNGKGDSLNLANSGGYILPKKSFTTSVWTYHNAKGGLIIGNSEGEYFGKGNDLWRLMYSTSFNKFGFEFRNLSLDLSNNAYYEYKTEGIWRHFTVVYSNDTGYATVYLNGNRVFRTYSPLFNLNSSTSRNLEVGTDMDGLIDNVMLFDRELSEKEIINVYASQLKDYHGSLTDIYRVTNLNDKGPGSLREGILTQERPRTIVFEVSGTIDLDSSLRLDLDNSYLTIAGQTAPSPGITIKDFGFEVDAHDLLIQHLRVRPGDFSLGGQIKEWTHVTGDIYSAPVLSNPDTAYSTQGSVWWNGNRINYTAGGKDSLIPGQWDFVGSWQGGTLYVNVGQNPGNGVLKYGVSKSAVSDAFGVRGYSYNFVIDHCSVSWSGDMNINIQGRNITVQNTIIAEALNNPLHPKGPHSRGLWIAAYGPHEGEDVLARGNLLTQNQNRNPAVMGGADALIVNNFISDVNIAGKHDDNNRYVGSITFDKNYVQRANKRFVAVGRNEDSRLYVGTDNILNGITYSTFEEVWDRAVSMSFGTVPLINRAREPVISYDNLNLLATSDVKQWVLDNSGARPVDRDPVDIRIINNVINGKGFIPASQTDVGGWPVLPENHRALTLPASPDADYNRDGYTNLENWLHDYSFEVEFSSGSVCGNGVLDIGEQCDFSRNRNNGEVKSSTKESWTEYLGQEDVYYCSFKCNSLSETKASSGLDISSFEYIENSTTLAAKVSFILTKPAKVAYSVDGKTFIGLGLIDSNYDGPIRLPSYGTHEISFLLSDGTSKRIVKRSITLNRENIEKGFVRGNRSSIVFDGDVDVIVGSTSDLDAWLAGNRPVRFNFSNSIVEFNYSFSSGNKLDLQTIIAGRNSTKFFIYGLENVKNLTLNRNLSSRLGAVCIHDREIFSESEMSDLCDGINDTYLELNNGTFGKYDLRITNDKMFIGNLRHSGISQVCLENWTCGDWSGCNGNPEETRSCIDDNNCGTTHLVPITSQSCYIDDDTGEDQGSSGGSGGGGSGDGGGSGSSSGSGTDPEEDTSEDESDGDGESSFIPDFEFPSGDDIAGGARNITNTFKEDVFNKEPYAIAIMIILLIGVISGIIWIITISYSPYNKKDDIDFRPVVRQ